MITLQLESEDFDIRELLVELEQKNMLGQMTASIKTEEIAAEGERNILIDFLEIVFKIDFKEEVAKLAFKHIVEFAFKKLIKKAFPDPHILIRLKNGTPHKIMYADKAPETITDELLAYINRGDVVSVKFKSYQ